MAIKKQTFLFIQFSKNQEILQVVFVLCLGAQSCATLCDPMDCSPPGSSVHGNSPGKNTGVGGHALLHRFLYYRFLFFYCPLSPIHFLWAYLEEDMFSHISLHRNLHSSGEAAGDEKHPEVHTAGLHVDPALPGYPSSCPYWGLPGHSACSSMLFFQCLFLALKQPEFVLLTKNPNW